MMDSLFMRSGIHGLGSSITVSSGLDARPGPSQFSAVGRSSSPATNAISVDKGGSDEVSSFNFSPFRSLFSRGANKQTQSPKGVALDDAVSVDKDTDNLGVPEEQNGNWVLKILHVNSLWSSEKQGNEEGEEGENQGQHGNCPSSSDSDSASTSASCSDDNGEDGCKICDDDDDNGKIEFDRNSFSKLLKKVSLAEARLYAQMSYLGSLAYDIPKIKPGNLLKRHGMRFVSSSVEKREQLEKEQAANATAKAEQQPSSSENNNSDREGEALESGDKKDEAPRVSASTAFHIAASAASFLHARTRSILPFSSSNDDKGQDMSKETVMISDNLNINSSELASLMATTDSVTAVVAAKEEVKQAVADDLNSINSAPCEWFVCDDDKNATRLFVIQGSETLASWHANLLFEPVKFEGLDVPVHRGIYEAAKGMYQQMLPEIRAHMKTHGRHAKLRFTGHSLGGSLSMLINIMLLMRGEVPYSSLLPVITFGSPCIMCGGDALLRKLGLPKSHIQAIVMHRDIVPRAFSCHYPPPAAELLKAVNGNFRTHPCLNNQKLLYTPVGEVLVLQPDAKYSPQHDLLPSGCGLYLLTCEAEKILMEAKKAFLNIPHPLEILSDRAAYGNEGTIQRDHDMNSYLRCVRSVIRQELTQMRKAQRERRRKLWWPLLSTRLVQSHLIVGPTSSPSNVNFSGIMRTGRDSFKRFSRLVASQHMHLLVILLFPAKMLLIGAFSVIGHR